MKDHIERYKLELASALIDRVTELIEGNEYQNYLYGELIRIKVELERQLSHYKHV